MGNRKGKLKEDHYIIKESTGPILGVTNGRLVGRVRERYRQVYRLTGVVKMEKL